MNTFDWINKWSIYQPEKTAIREYETGRTLSYQELENIGNRIANLFTKEYNLGIGDRVAVLSKNRLEFVMLFIAAQKTGVTLVPLNFRLAPREIDYLLEDCSPSLLFYDPDFADALNSCKACQEILRKIDIQSFGDEVYASKQKVEKLNTEASFSEDTPVFILYTSGTTGRPKGAKYTHKMMFWNSLNTSLRCELTENDRTIISLPFFHTGGWNVLLTPILHHGGYILLMNKFEPEDLIQALQDDEITIQMVVPTMLKMLAETDNFNSAKFPTLRYMLIGGEALPLPVIETWHNKGVPIRQGYGLTEFGPNVTSLDHKDADRKIGSIGKPNFYVEYFIADEHGNPTSQGEIGEFWLKGPVQTPGYWHNDEATAQASENGFFKTGDMVREDDEGYLYIVDRKKHMYISGGENVYPVEVENFLYSHSSILEVAVIGVPDKKWGEVGHAFVVKKEGQEPSESDILNYCVGKLAKFKTPKYVSFIEELPKGDTGKINRKELHHLLTQTTDK